jgi:hypothetical protein
MAGNNNPLRVPVPPLLDTRGGLGDTSLFSASLPVLPHEKCMPFAIFLPMCISFVNMCDVSMRTLVEGGKRKGSLSSIVEYVNPEQLFIELISNPMHIAFHKFYLCSIA